MAKILVADDNSNVQRTVSLALSDLGVEVVAVNNGEAAVRKLANFTPDLILADIFMPVRNGYEVCDYVKHNSQFAQTPVVLLVGAFDPFDEREAQRVGADGILKKPFVPPDPLIAMVKTLLDRVMASRPVQAPVGTVSAATTQRSVATSAAKVLTEEKSTEEAAETDFGSRDRVDFGDGQRPVAFGDMFEVPAVDVEATPAEANDVKDDSLIVTSKRDAALGDPGFWRKDEEEEEEDKAKPAFESALASEDIPATTERPWLSAVPAVPAATEPENKTTAPAETTFEIVREDQEETLATANPNSILQDPAAHATLTVDASKPADLAANPLDWMASAPPLPVKPVESVEEEADVAASRAEEEVPVEATAADPIDHTEKSPVVIPDVTPIKTAPEVSVVEHADVSAPKHAAPTPESPTKAVQQVEVEENPNEHEHEVTPTHHAEPPEPAPIEEWADLAEVVKEEARTMAEHSVSPAVANPVAVANEAKPQQEMKSGVESPGVANPSQPVVSDPAVIDAVVQRVMNKMSPQVIDIITREFLRPVVQALVKREIEKH